MGKYIEGHVTMTSNLTSCSLLHSSDVTIWYCKILDFVRAQQTDNNSVVPP